MIFVLLGFAIVLGVLIALVLWPWLQDLRSANWPVAEATITSGKVYASAGAIHAQYTVEVTYTYRVEGRTYEGEFKLVVPDRAAAEKLRDQWSAGPVPARYDPRRPSQSQLDPFRGAGPRP